MAVDSLVQLLLIHFPVRLAAKLTAGLRGYCLTALVVCSGCVTGLAPSSALATTTYFTDLGSWQIAAQAVAGSTQAVELDSATLQLSDQLAGPPVADAALGHTLTFSAAAIPSCPDITLIAADADNQTLEDSWIFDDQESGSSVFDSVTLSIGDVDDFEDDDFTIDFLAAHPRAVGIFLVGNFRESGEVLTVAGATGVLLSIPAAGLPAYDPAGAFVGFVADEPIYSVAFDESSFVPPGLDGNDIGIKQLWLAPSASIDSDNDNLSDCQEIGVYGTSPMLIDTDMDGLGDGDEVFIHSTNPLSSDTDNDALSDHDEIHIHGTDPALPDTDSDGLYDGAEIGVHSSNPLVADTDGDTIPDGVEARAWVFVTSSLHQGNFGSLAGADAICDARAQQAGLLPAQGYRAWLSTTTVDAITRLADQRFVLVDGRDVAQTLADLTDGQLAAPIEISELGAVVHRPVWTGTLESGTLTPGNVNCNDWSSNLPTVPANGGMSDLTDRWSSSLGNAFCDSTGPLYCFGRGLSDPLLRDSDGDGVDDNDELAFGTDPGDASNAPAVVEIPLSAFATVSLLLLFAATYRAVQPA